MPTLLMSDVYDISLQRSRQHKARALQTDCKEYITGSIICTINIKWMKNHTNTKILLPLTLTFFGSRRSSNWYEFDTAQTIMT